MRTEQQVKRKLNELLMQRQSIKARLSEVRQNEQGNSEAGAALEDQAGLVEEKILLLEWVLNEPTGAYHT